MRTLITGSAGFIGSHAVSRFLKAGHKVLGVDNINDYYSVDLKHDRLREYGIEDFEKKVLINSSKYPKYSFARVDISEKEKLGKIWESFRPEVVVHLAAQAGVRYGIKNAHAYTQSNLVGFVNLIELARHSNIKHFVYASSSSVYGLNNKIPFEEKDPVDHPASLYASTKRSNELIAHSYSNLYNLPTTGLRFFTVYGPWGRPDMFMFLIAEAIRKDTRLNVYTRKRKSLWRDYTFIQDIVNGIYEISKVIPSPSKSSDSLEPNKSGSPFAIYNIGRGHPIENIKIIEYIEELMGGSVRKNFVEAPNTEPFKTWAKTTELQGITGYSPKVGYKKGVRDFINWYKNYYRLGA